MPKRRGRCEDGRTKGKEDQRSFGLENGIGENHASNLARCGEERGNVTSQGKESHYPADWRYHLRATEEKKKRKEGQASEKSKQKNFVGQTLDDQLGDTRKRKGLLKTWTGGVVNRKIHIHNLNS